MRPDPRYELALASQVPHTQTEHPDTSAVAVTHVIMALTLPIGSGVRLSASFHVDLVYFSLVWDQTSSAN